MLRTIPITEARDEMTSLPERLAEEQETVAVTRRGKPVLALMPWELYETIIETLEIMGDEALMSTLKKSVQEAKTNQVISWDEAEKILDQ